MKITGYKLYRTRLRCRQPFKIASGVSDVCEGLLLRLEAGELRGTGEAVPSPYLTGESLEGTQHILKKVFLPQLVGSQAWGVASFHRTMEALAAGHTSAKAAVDLALHDLLARAARVPLAQFLGGDLRPVPTDYSIGLCPPDVAALEARRIVENGFQCVKLKVGSDPGLDVDRVRAVRGAIGPDMLLRIDANEGWHLDQATRALEQMARYRLELVEQPLARWDLKGMAELRRRTDVPVAADESVHTPRDALRALEAEAVDIINIKLMKSGGLHPAREIAAMARAAGVRLMVGGMVGESGVAVAAAASMASAWEFEYADLDADLLLADRLVKTGGLGLEEDARILSASPGTGVDRLDERFLTEV